MLAAACPGLAQANTEPKPITAPQPGDSFVHLSGPKVGQPVVAEDLQIGAPKLAYPIDPASGEVRRARASQVVLTRLDPALMSDETREVAWNGIVAYSAICTHNGCPVTGMRNPHTLLCPCHESEFDIADKGKVVHGPAQRRLANLPLKTTGDAIMVAGPFSGIIGAQTK
ncbi:Ubiquinol-cytochrome C reductase iron-sulfur subunit [Hyphomicrobium sulfonivorans]|uniref:Ubiquinol-cytochrome C reductase iron-sulfur subunit n=2 Tax=Hyphomicrobium sulfonivorans TaxID=121290 RepID=A0A125NVC1_HYPSL|nr:Ubiquinol-cytochrome C reductase iron-sulfur subunit [Hyphomicrobium sulfonivorans]